MRGVILKKIRRLAWWQKGGLLFLALFLLVFFRPGVGFLQSALRQGNPPDAILVLGGSYYTEQVAAAAALEYPDIPVIVSSGRARPCTYYVFAEEARVAWNRVLTDYRATDTLTNFTSTLPHMKQLGVRKVLVVTTRAHWRRAQYLALFVYESAGIAVEPKTYKRISGEEENDRDIMLDSLRAAWWALFGDWLTPVRYQEENAILAQLEQREADCQFGTRKMPIDPYAFSAGSLPAVSSSSEVVHALTRGDRYRTMQLINQGVSPSTLTSEGEPLLSLAIRVNNVEIVKFLIEKGASLYQTGRNGRRPIDELSAHPAVLSEVADLVERETAARAKSQSKVHTLVGEVSERENEGTGTSELILGEAIEAKRYASGGFSSLRLKIRNTSSTVQQGVVVSARFGAGMLERLEGPASIPAGEQAEFSISLRDSSLYRSLAQIQLDCQSCSSQSKQLSRFEITEKN